MAEREEVRNEATTLGLGGRMRRFIRDVLAELRKCTWPSRNELIETTILVIVMMVVLSVFILGSDSMFQFIFRNILKIA